MRCLLMTGWTMMAFLAAGGSVQAQWVSLFQGRVYVGPPPHPFPLASDNGIPGSGAYAYNDYDWPSLRQALNTYGLFGRKAPRLPLPLPQRAGASPESPAVPAFGPPGQVDGWKEAGPLRRAIPLDAPPG